MAAFGRDRGSLERAADSLSLAQLLANCPLPRNEAEILLAHAAGKERAWLYAHGDDPADPGLIFRFEALVTRRRAGTPIAYLLGCRAFWDLDLEVGPAVLIPRPETELLVEAGLERCPQARRVLDLGTGSGALALALARVLPDAQVIATDFSKRALAVARRNARRNDCRNVTFRQGRWFEAVPGIRFDLIVCNPPYIAAGDPHLLQGDLRFEPPDALVSGPEGMDDLEIIIAAAPDHLETGGWLIVEHGHEQQARVEALFDRKLWGQVEALVDLASQPRAVAARIA